jgi:hypothetical protein
MIKSSRRMHNWGQRVGADTSRENSPVSIAVVGFALPSYPVPMVRG